MVESWLPFLKGCSWKVSLRRNGYEEVKDIGIWEKIFQADLLANAKILKWGQGKQGGQSGWKIFMKKDKG